MGKRIFPIFIIMYFVLGVSLGKGKHPCPKSEATDEGVIFISVPGIVCRNLWNCLIARPVPDYSVPLCLRI